MSLLTGPEHYSENIRLLGEFGQQLIPDIIHVCLLFVY